MERSHSVESGDQEIQGTGDGRDKIYIVTQKEPRVQ